MAWIWAILSAVISLHLLRKFLTNKKQKLPGPSGLPILGHLHLLGKNPHHSLRDLARKHGPIMGIRLGSVPAVVVSSPAAAELVLKTHDLAFASRPWLHAFNHVTYELKSLSFSRYGPYWREMRKLCTMELLSSLKINQFQGLRRVEVGLLVESLKQAAERQEVVDLSTKVTALTCDINCRIVFGRKFSDRDLDGQKGFKTALDEMSELGARFNLADYFPFFGVLDVQGMNRRMKGLMKSFDGLLEKIIDDHIEKRQGKKEREDFVDTMIDLMESSKDDSKFGRGNAKAMLLDMLIGGTDTSATAADWALSELIRHPKVMKKLQQEIESVVGMECMVEEAHINKLEYLNCVVKESLRFHPVAPMFLPHESVEDCVLDGFHIPKKTRIMVNAYAIMNDPNIWPDPDKFLPERFIGSNIDPNGQDFQFIPFGSGRRSCPGRPLALTVVKFLLAQLVHCFDWKLPNGMEASDMDMSEHFGVVTCRVEHLMAIPTYRLLK